MNDIELKIRALECIIMMPNMEGFDDEGVKSLDDSEDERTTAIIDGFDGIDSNLPINQQAIVVGYLGSPSRKFEDDDYFSDELDNSDPDESDDDEGPKFEKFRNEQLNKDYKFKWGMEFNSISDFIDAIREWSLLNGREITFVKN